MDKKLKITIDKIILLALAIGLGIFLVINQENKNANEGLFLVNGKEPSFYDYHTFFFTILDNDERQEIFNTEIKNRYVTWEFYVKSSGTSGEYQVLGLKDPPKEYNIGSDIGVSFKKEEKSKLNNYSKGDIMKVKGRIIKYGNTINAHIFYMDNAIILDN